MVLSDIYQQNVKTVSQITREIRSVIENRFQFVRIVGEISNYRKPHSGHSYFNLKDEHAQIRAVLFRNQGRYLSEQITDGQQVICDGRISLYETRGEYQIIVDSIDFHGTGHLQIAFEKLKRKLQHEGMFDQSLKKDLPAHIQNILLLTSPTGAAVHDFLSICYKRKADLSVQILPVRVQGQDAVSEIVSALETAEEIEPDVIVICRGGGSIEDLWTFNEEPVARAIHRQSIPVITGIGHEIDSTIADYCADFRCATPTAAAELLIPRPRESEQLIADLMYRIARTILWQIHSTRARVLRAHQFLTTFERSFYPKTLELDILTTRLTEAISTMIVSNESQLQLLHAHLERLSPINRLGVHQVRLGYCLEKLKRSIVLQINNKRARFQERVAILDSVSPLATLSRGYSIASKIDSDEIISDSRQVRPDESIRVKLHRGALECRVTRRSKT